MYRLRYFFGLIFLFFSSAISLADVLSDKITDDIHQNIFLSEKDISSWASTLDGTCRVLVNLPKPQYVASLGIKWSGACPDGTANGEGELTILFDGIPIFTEVLGAATGSAVIQGVPISTLQSEDFKILQSVCKDAGILISNREGMLIAEFPNDVKPIFWTIHQNTFIAAHNGEAKCDGRVPSLAAFIKGNEVLGTTGTAGGYKNLAQYLEARPNLRLQNWMTAYQDGLKFYDTEIVRINAQKKAVADAAVSANNEKLANVMLDPSYVIENMGDYFEVLGFLRAAKGLSEGRSVIAKTGNVSFNNDQFVSVYSDEASYADKAREDLGLKSGNFKGWDSYFKGVELATKTAGGGTSIVVACAFDSDVDVTKLSSATYKVFAKLISMDGRRVVLSCKPS